MDARQGQGPTNTLSEPPDLNTDDRPVLVTGASGYVGGRLVPMLLERGHAVRCLARTPRKLEDRSWTHHPRVEIVEGDLSSLDDARRAFEGCRAAYFLVHSMAADRGGFSELDRKLAENAAQAAEAADLQQIIYLAGLGEMGEDLSPHLRSRREVEEVLRSGKTPVTVLRAAMIIGAGSASFEILRYIVERLPVMVTPLWVRTECQPIAVRDVLFYLAESLVTPETRGKTIDIGGPDVVTYRELINTMAEVRGLRKRLLISVPVLTPRLSSLWLGLVTPVTASIARPLAEGLRNRVVCRNDDANKLMPHNPITVREAIERALARWQSRDIETSWSAAGPIPGDPDWAGGTVFNDTRNIAIDAPADEVFKAVCRIGGGHGWYAANILWKIRGLMDLALGGPGLQRGRRDPENVRFGEALDFWRVTGLDRNRWLRLNAEMRLPGEAVLQFTITPDKDNPGRCSLEQAAKFRPKGLLGLAYWYAVLPLHGIVFKGMLRGIRASAEKHHAAEAKPSDTAA